MKKYLISFAIILSLGFVALQTVKANPSYFMPTVQTATATSTLAIVAPNLTAASTTSLILDSYLIGTIAVTNKATLLVQYTASTSASQMAVKFTYSQDGVDYFNNNLATATTTGTYVVNLETPDSYSILGNTSASTTRVAISVTTPTRYVKATFSSLVATSSVWAQFVPQREIPSAK